MASFTVLIFMIILTVLSAVNVYSLNVASEKTTNNLITLYAAIVMHIKNMPKFVDAVL